MTTQTRSTIRYTTIAPAQIKHTIAIDRNRKIKLIIPAKTEVDDEMIDEEKKEDEKITDSNIPIGP